MPISKKQMQFVQNYKSGHYYSPRVNMLLKYRDTIQNAASESGVSLNVYINRLIQKDLAAKGIEYHFPGENNTENEN